MVIEVVSYHSILATSTTSERMEGCGSQGVDVRRYGRTRVDNPVEKVLLSKYRLVKTE